MNDRSIILTPRQTEIVECLLRGLSNKEIARSLGITDGTVKAHLHVVFDKLQSLGINSRGKLVAHYRGDRLASLTPDTTPAAPQAPAPQPPE